MRNGDILVEKIRNKFSILKQFKMHEFTPNDQKFIAIDIGSAKYVKIDCESGYSSEKQDATRFTTLEDFLLLKNGTICYSCLRDNMFEFIFI
jgi:hypothetical protein